MTRIQILANKGVVTGERGEIKSRNSQSHLKPEEASHRFSCRVSGSVLSCQRLGCWFQVSRTDKTVNFKFEVTEFKIICSSVPEKKYKLAHLTHQVYTQASHFLFSDMLQEPVTEPAGIRHCQKMTNNWKVQSNRGKNRTAGWKAWL